MENIKPCPFCKGTKVAVDSKAGPVHYRGGKRTQTKTFSVRCNKCHARGPTISGVYPNTILPHDCPEYEEAIRRWNDR